jgi:hypothetical protein
MAVHLITSFISVGSFGFRKALPGIPQSSQSFETSGSDQHIERQSSRESSFCCLGVGVESRQLESSKSTFSLSQIEGLQVVRGGPKQVGLCKGQELLTIDSQTENNDTNLIRKLIANHLIEYIQMRKLEPVGLVVLTHVSSLR